MAVCERHIAHLWECLLEPVASLQCQNQQYTQRTANKRLWKRKWIFSICAMSETRARGLPNPSHWIHANIDMRESFPSTCSEFKIAPPWPHLQSIKVCINIQLHPVRLTVHSCADSFSNLRVEVEASSETLGSLFQTTHRPSKKILNNKVMVGSNLTWKMCVGRISLSVILSNT